MYKSSMATNKGETVGERESRVRSGRVNRGEGTGGATNDGAASTGGETEESGGEQRVAPQQEANDEQGMAMGDGKTVWEERHSAEGMAYSEAH